MARCLIIGCGCRGQLLARELGSAGHAVRGTTRSVDRLEQILASGAEPVLADPDRVATLVEAFSHVTVVCVLLGSAVGTRAEVAALHSTRLEMLLTKLVDTTARGVVYEARGSVDPEILAGGAERVRSFAERSLASYALVDADPGSPGAWVAAAVGAVDQVMGHGGG
ncbi:MAG TPA: NAD(P)-binding domain-containing protein [Solirubrobacteraceae bacterium]|nr:NAD(P)-binding domain-containing protein [Solirubrobacteraceae bacterium]